MSVIYENGHPFFIIPHYKEVSGTFPENLDEWLEEPHTEIEDNEEYSSGVQHVVCPEISSSLGKYIAIYPRQSVIGIMNSDVGYLSPTTLRNFNSPNGSILSLPWDTTKSPSILIATFPQDEILVMHNVKNAYLAGKYIISFRVSSQINPIIFQDIAIEISMTGRLRILIRSSFPATLRFFILNNGTVVDIIPMINILKAGKVGIFDNGILTEGRSVFWSDGSPPDKILCKSNDAHDRVIGKSTPNSEGVWSFVIPTPKYELIFYREGCQPIAHGPFVI